MLSLYCHNDASIAVPFNQHVKTAKEGDLL